MIGGRLGSHLVAFGGDYGTTDIDAWAFTPGDTGQWTPLPTRGSPGAFSLAATYDPVGDRVVLFNGWEVWALQLDAAPAWVRFGAPAIPGPVRADASAICDPVRRRMIIYGGEVPVPHFDDYTVSDVWALDLDGPPAWNLLGSGPVPKGSAGHAAFYDPLRDRMVVMGGYWKQASRPVWYGASIWATPLDSTLSWTVLTLTGLQPPAPPTSSLTYDPNRDRMLLFSGNGVWSRPAADAGQWQVLDALGPGPGVASPVVFDPLRDQAVALFTAAPGALAEQAWGLVFAPPRIALLKATATFDEVEIAWHSSEARGRAATVQRLEESEGWEPIASVAFDENGTVELHDREVQPGARYAYRLGVQTDRASWYTDSTWVDIPLRPTFALAGARPNPAVRTLRLVLSLPDAAPARLEVFDLHGRRLLARDVGSLGPGTHSLDLAGEPPLRPGVYLVRLLRGRQSFATRAIVIR